MNSGPLEESVKICQSYDSEEPPYPNGQKAIGEELQLNDKGGFFLRARWLNANTGEPQDAETQQGTSAKRGGQSNDSFERHMYFRCKYVFRICKTRLTD